MRSVFCQIASGNKLSSALQHPAQIVICIYLHIFVCTYICTRICAYLSAHIYLHIFICTSICKYIVCINLDMTGKWKIFPVLALFNAQSLWGDTPGETCDWNHLYRGIVFKKMLWWHTPTMACDWSNINHGIDRFSKTVMSLMWQ